MKKDAKKGKDREAPEGPSASLRQNSWHLYIHESDSPSFQAQIQEALNSTAPLAQPTYFFLFHSFNIIFFVILMKTKYLTLI